MKTKSILLLSGGLDSRVVLKLLQEQNIDVHCLYFKLPFGCNNPNNFKDLEKFAKENKAKLTIIDLTIDPYLSKYLEIIKKPKFGRGSSMNPCKDCKIFMFKIAKEFLDKEKADFVATGEVIGQREMSQMKRYLKLTEEESNLQGLILRPLSAKLLDETIPERQGLVNRDKLFGIQGKQRKIQIELARHYKINYPNSSGGCLLCEKEYRTKLKDLFKNTKEITLHHILSLKYARHFRNNGKIIIGKNEKHNQLLEELNKSLKWNILIPEFPGPTIIYEHEGDRKLVEQMLKVYSNNDFIGKKDFEKYKI